MALVTFARRFHQTTHSRLFLPYILKSLAGQHVSSTSFHSNSTQNFSQTFHQTLDTQYNQQSLRFSTLQPFNNHKIYETINFSQLTDETNEHTQLGVSKLLELLLVNDFPSEEEEEEATAVLDESGPKPNEGLIISAIWALREEWKLAFFVFKWGQKWSCNGEKVWSLMIWLLGNHKKFNTAWCLIRDLHKSSMDTQKAMLILIDRYAAANEPAEAIRTFQIMDKFKMSPDQKSCYMLLYTLCKHGNIEEAEEFMFLNKKLFPLETEGFNIILNGWCNISIDILEAKRVWREMDKCQIIPDETSYTHMISCFSKVNNLFDSLRLFDEMKKRGFAPGRGVYNSLIYVLAHENCLKEALRIVDKMKEIGLQPDSATYNFLICPLCEAGKLEDAKTILSTMLGENISPTIDTYHAFLEGASFEETLEILNRMEKAGLGPSMDSFIIILGKFLKLDQTENALKIWVKMKEYEVFPDSAHFSLMVEGLLRCGLMVKAREIYAEMISTGMTDDPKLKRLLKEPLQYGKHGKVEQIDKCVKKGTPMRRGKRSFIWIKRGQRSRT